jgi:phage terminase small subunit
MPRHIEGKLTRKQQAFIKEYIKTGHGTNSAIKAGYSKKTAQEMASENLSKPIIKAKIEKVMSEEAKKLGLNAEYVLSKLKKISDLEIIGNEKIASTILKSLELEARHLDILNENKKVIDMRLSEHAAIIKELGED